MKATTPRILAVAALAAGLGLLASLWLDVNPLWRTGPGERALHAAINATAPTPPPGVTPAAIGDPMPAIALPGLDGKIVDLAAHYRGKRLLINVWASWCGPCIEEMPELQRFAMAQGAEGVQVIGLALDSPEAVRDFLSRVPVGYPIVLDTPGPADASVWLGNAKGVLPYTVLIGTDGRVERQKIGPFQHGELSDWAQ
ncbi:TlpA disulfide reductase family protein [Pseudoxanthomonas sp. LjRoot168]|uniref:TlpA family protein disulfide reductase n=1 Tax=unclassified Pseudoxanthomonas TaxID=2645906 RepID=UPI0026250BC5|nr:TlpA disulfide reductase family protein [uncultured Pseudoxanthomonas sp.]